MIFIPNLTNTGNTTDIVSTLRQMPAESLLFLLTIVLFFVSLIISASVKSKFKKYSKVRPYNGMTGSEAARKILAANGIYDVDIYNIGGSLTDNYNPLNKRLNLSDTVCNVSSVSAIAVAAHECGHAIQHAKKYPFLMLRKALVPVTNIGSTGSYIAIIVGLLFGMTKFVEIGAYLFGAVVLFNLITLPVEINASRRAMAEIERLNILTADERHGGQKVLFAAAMTYFIALVSSLVQFLRLLAIANRRRR